MTVANLGISKKRTCNFLENLGITIANLGISKNLGMLTITYFYLEGLGKSWKH